MTRSSTAAIMIPTRTPTRINNIIIARNVKKYPHTHCKLRTKMFVTEILAQTHSHASLLATFCDLSSSIKSTHSDMYQWLNREKLSTVFHKIFYKLGFLNLLEGTFGSRDDVYFINGQLSITLERKQFLGFQFFRQFFQLFRWAFNIHNDGTRSYIDAS